jgi:hypothetical protein
MSDLWAMIKSSFARGWCAGAHRHMWKVWTPTARYSTMKCRICGREHATRVAPIAEPIILAVQRPFFMAARWYRHQMKGD